MTSKIVKDAKALLEGKMFAYSVCFYHGRSVTIEKIVISALCEEDALEKIRHLNYSVRILYIERVEDD